MTTQSTNYQPKPLEAFALVPSFDTKIEELAALAEPEDWGYASASAVKKNPVLRNYINYTFARVEEEGKIEVAADGSAAGWNTGLVTTFQEPIFMLLSPNKFAGDGRRWHFWKWCRQGEAALNKLSKLPEMAHYFDDPTCLVLDTRWDLRANIEHIIADNRGRFPEPYRSMSNFELHNFLRGAIDAARSRVRRNYKAAIPQYYRGAVQLLLPLCLKDAGKADLALVVERFDGFYRAATCLTLDMAYNNARQLARPDKDWLQP
jgi:hypothetical protein